MSHVAVLTSDNQICLHDVMKVTPNYGSLQRAMWTHKPWWGGAGTGPIIAACRAYADGVNAPETLYFTPVPVALGPLSEGIANR